MSKISELSDGGALQSTDYLIAVRSGGNVKVQPGSMSVDINGGTIDGVTIGGSSAGAITGTNLAYTGTLTGGTGVINIGSGQVYKDASGNVGIGTSSPSKVVHVKASSDSSGTPIIGLSPTTTDNIQGGIGCLAGGELQVIGTNQTRFFTASTEAMRIDSSGNLLVGKTSTALADVGHNFSPSGFSFHTRDGGPVAYFNRETSDGDIAIFYKDGTTVGSIGSVAGQDIVIGSGSAGFRFLSTGPAIQPRNADGTANNDAIDLGLSTNRFKDLYLSGGVYLGGTGAANQLDDYEEGTWTPTCVCSGQTITTTQRSGKYTKIGRIVHAECAIVINTVSGTASGATTITGLPFNNDGDSYSGMGALNYNDGFANTLYASWIQLTTAYMRSGTRSSSNDGGGFSAGGYINIRWSYITNA